MRILINEKLSPHRFKTPEGYLICTDAILARTGKQEYRKGEIWGDCEDSNEVIEIDRKPEQVFDPKTLASFENKPITIEHPNENVNPSNYKDYSVGFVRDVHKGVAEGQDVILGTLVITDEKAISEIENGEHTELSCGYDCDITDSESPEQINIRGNHVALCECGRAGIARIVDSMKDSIESDIEEELKFNGVKCKVSKLNSGKYLIECETKHDADIAEIEIRKVDGNFERINNTTIRLSDSDINTYKFEYETYGQDFKTQEWWIEKHVTTLKGKNAYEAAKPLSDSIQIIRVYKNGQLFKTFTSRELGEWHGRGNKEQLRGLDSMKDNYGFILNKLYNSDYDSIEDVKKDLGDSVKDEDRLLEVYKLCKENNWYTAGNIEEYEYMLNHADIWPVEKIAMNIANHSHESYNNILAKLKARLTDSNMKDAAIHGIKDPLSMEKELQRALNDKTIEYSGDAYDNKGYDTIIFSSADGKKAAAEKIAKYLKSRGYTGVGIDNEAGDWFAYVHSADQSNIHDSIKDKKKQLPTFDNIAKIVKIAKEFIK